MKSHMMIHVVAVTLVIVGALNWGLVGLFNYNLVSMLLGSSPMLEQLVYILVGASGIFLAFTHFSYCQDCARMMKK
jgi:uncharacterized protein